MLGILVFIIIVVSILSTVSKNKQKASYKEQNRQPSAPPQQKRYEMPEKHQTTIRQQNRPHPDRNKKEAARVDNGAAQAMDPSDVRRDLELMAQSHLWEAAGVEADDGAILASAKLNSYEVGKSNEADSRKNLLDPVYDLMAMGPDTSIPGRRDFEAEAEKLLNRLTL